MISASTGSTTNRDDELVGQIERFTGSGLRGREIRVEGVPKQPGCFREEMIPGAKRFPGNAIKSRTMIRLANGQDSIQRSAPTMNSRTGELIARSLNAISG